MSTTSLPKGLASRYRVEELLGRGGFSKVYRATQLDLDRQVALKIMLPLGHEEYESGDDSSGPSGDLTERFSREARMISKLRCQHTVTMYEYGSEDGRVFMCMEYVDGKNLADVLKDEGAIEPDRVAHIAKQLLMSLAEAHSLGIMHRDIKPQNIMIFDHMGIRDQVRLLDFGIVKITNNNEYDQEVADLTSQDTLLGTPRYMAPEYIRGEEYLPSSDLYGVGLVLYGLVVGEQAIKTNSSFQILSKQLDEESFSIGDEHDEIDLSLRLIINKLIRKQLTERYESAQDALDDLEKREHANLLATISASHALTIEATPEPTSNGKGYFIAAMVFVSLLTGVIAWGIVSKQSEKQEPVANADIAGDGSRTTPPTEKTAAAKDPSPPTAEVIPTATIQPLVKADAAVPGEDHATTMAATEPDTERTRQDNGRSDKPPVKVRKRTSPKKRKKTRTEEAPTEAAPDEVPAADAVAPSTEPKPEKKVPVEAPKKRVVAPIGTGLAPVSNKKEAGLIKIK